MLPYVDVEPLGAVLEPRMRPWRPGATVVAALALLASLVPAWRATRVDPMTALRAE